jgi:hypothetical protein
MFEGKVLQGFLALLSNITSDWKGVPRKNALAFWPLYQCIIKTSKTLTTCQVNAKKIL